MPRQVTEAEINDFLESKPNIQISTIYPEGYPYNSALMVPLRKITRQDIFGTQKMRRKVQNILTNHDKIYFSIDDESYPYRGVKGKAIALISENIQKNLSTRR
jgi:pyridoxamine 5'-phosphate oxidase-like protein